jgi:hypothetical protein
MSGGEWCYLLENHTECQGLGCFSAIHVDSTLLHIRAFH